MSAPWWQLPFSAARITHPRLPVHLAGFGITADETALSLQDWLAGVADSHFEDIGIGRTQLIEHLDRLLNPVKRAESGAVTALTLLGGRNKAGLAEELDLRLTPGSITSIVGPTGSGKSRLLADIEWLAQGDTPTGRRILINDAAPDPELRFSLEHKLVAQLSQNMNFVMDLSVEEFIRMHAESRDIDPACVAGDILLQANQLAGERFTAQTPVTALSGGQSRALMIADTAFLSASPVVLIDEVENAGIDRKRALQLLVRQEKIVLIATHDPLLALLADRRLVIRNGGVACVIETAAAERAHLAELEALDARVQKLRQRLRSGELLVDF